MSSARIPKIQLPRSMSGRDLPMAVEDEAKHSISAATRQQAKLDEATVNAVRTTPGSSTTTDPGAAAVGEQAVAADAAFNLKLDDVHELLSGCLSVADVVAETAPAMPKTASSPAVCDRMRQQQSASQLHAPSPRTRQQQSAPQSHAPSPRTRQQQSVSQSRTRPPSPARAIQMPSSPGSGYRKVQARVPRLRTSGVETAKR